MWFHTFFRLIDLKMKETELCRFVLNDFLLSHGASCALSKQISCVRPNCICTASTKRTVSV